MIAGRNGSGKSTLLRLLATALRPDAGEGQVEGYDLVRHRHDVRQLVTLLGHASNLYEPLTALQNLQIFARFLGLDDDRKVLVALLERVGLDERADDPVTSYSAGMRKRLSIARVLLRRAPIVLLDEPYGQLDPPGFHFVDRLVATLRDEGATVLLATHQLDRAASMADRGIVLEEGRVRWEGAASRLPIDGGLDPRTEAKPLLVLPEEPE